MAQEDKRIRVTADTSPLREIRQELSGITREIEELSNKAASVNLGGQEGLSDDNRELQRQIDLLNQRRDLLRSTIERVDKITSPIRQRISDNRMDISELERERKKYSTDSADYRQLSEEINRLRRENNELQTRLDRVEGDISIPSREVTRPQPPTSETPRRDSEWYRKRIKENEEDLEELKKRRKLLDPESMEGQSEIDAIDREINRIKASNMELSNMMRDEKRYEDKQVERGERPANNEVSLLRQLVQVTTEINNKIEKSPRGKGGRDDDRYGSDAGQQPPIPPAGGDGSNIRPQQDPRDREPSRFAQVGTGTTSILLHGAVEAMGRQALARNNLEGTAGMVGALGNMAGGTIASIGNAFGPVGGAIGGIIGGLASGITSLVVNKWMMELQALEGAERNSLRYAQTTGSSIRGTIAQGGREGRFAARDLGMDIGEYMGRRGDLLRAAGGRILGATEEDVSGAREMNSLMAVSRAYGLSDQVINSLQGTMRFAERGDIMYGSSTDSPSAIIRLFENTMKELEIPFSEIASTMDESLNTFVRTADSVLEKAGDFDAGKIATVLNSVRQSTGFEGRQLERVQAAVTGQRVSQDDVTQALLMRVAREVNPEAATYPELMASIEKMPESPELQESFINKIEEMVGGNETQLASVLKRVFPDLSWTDIQDTLRRRNETDQETPLGTWLTNGGLDMSPETVRGNEGRSQYDPSIARRTVGVIEAANAEKRNERIPEGERAVAILSKIEEALKPLMSTDEAVEGILKFLNDTFGSNDKANEWVRNKTKISYRNDGYMITGPDSTMMVREKVLTNLMKVSENE